MKKLVLTLAVLFSVAMVSCDGNKAANDSDSLNNDTNVEDTNVPDSANADSANADSAK